jgi:hypothetical protein
VSNKSGHDRNCGKIGNPIGLDKKFFKKNVEYSFFFPLWFVFNIVMYK